MTMNIEEAVAAVEAAGAEETAALEADKSVDAVEAFLAEESSSEEKEAEPQEKKETKEQPNDKVFAALARKKAKLAAERQAFLAEKQRWEMEIASRRGESEELTKYRETNKLAKEDPVKFLESVGIDYSDVTKRILERDTPDEKIKALAAELEAERKARVEREQAYERQALAAHQRQAEDQFLSIVHASDKYKSLQLHEREELVAAGNQMADALRERLGKAPTLEQVAEALAKSAQEYQQRFYEKLNSLYGSPVEKKSKTISNKMSSEVGVHKDVITHEDRIQAAIRMLEQQEKR